MPTYGLTGAVSVPQYAVLAGQYGADYGVAGPGDWRVTAVSGANQTVSVAPGTGYGKGAIDVDTVEATLSTTNPGSGSRWDTVVRRRTWATDAAEFLILAGTSAKAISAQRLVSTPQAPAVQDDQPIALVRFTSGQQMPAEIIDLRCWHGNGGLVAASVEALGYLDRVGSHVHIQSTGDDYVRALDAQQNPAWVLRYRAPYLQRAGVATFPSFLATQHQLTVPLPAEFTVPPIVTATLVTTGLATGIVATAYDVTRTSFKVQMFHTTSTASFTSDGRVIHWTATQATATSAAG